MNGGLADGGKATDATRELLNMGSTEERFPVGAHVCLIYESEEERRALMSKFLEAGLRDGEKVSAALDCGRLLMEVIVPHWPKAALVHGGRRMARS